MLQQLICLSHRNNEFTVNMKGGVVFLSLVVAAFALPKNVFEFEQFEQPKNGGKHWALLVAGSNGYFNYRHQADVCHAYQILHANGIPDERIIVMMYDDIADNRENPVKDNIINRPDGPNVYDGVLKDYTGKDVNPETFLAVLQGESDKVNGGKVINSTQDDFIFVNFVDHGAPGLVAFGEKVLKASKLNDAIMDMYKAKKYAKMVIYVEACESGSMFEDMLPKDINVYATTASNAHESSYACYFDKTRKTYLGDVYSIKWMEDSDKEDLSQETLKKQFKITKNETKTSHVQEFGDLTMGDMTVAEFQGMQATKQKTYAPPKDACADAVKSEDVPLEILRRSIHLAENKEEAIDLENKLNDLLKEREIVDKTMKQIVAEVTDHHSQSTRIMETRHNINRWSCYESVVDHVEDVCKSALNIPVNDYALRKLYMFVNMCEEGIPLETIIDAASFVCEMEN